MEQRRTKTLQRDTQRLISQFDGPSAQNVGENPRHVPWNTKNTEFEGRRQNMMGCSCMKAVVYEHNPYLHDNVIESTVGKRFEKGLQYLDRLFNSLSAIRAVVPLGEKV